MPLADGWLLSPDTTSANMAEKNPPWVAVDGLQNDWQQVRLGAFGTLGLANEATGRFRRTIAVPKIWAGRQVTLVFDAGYWLWGLFPQARL